MLDGPNGGNATGSSNKGGSSGGGFADDLDDEIPPF